MSSDNTEPQMTPWGSISLLSKVTSSSIGCPLATSTIDEKQACKDEMKQVRSDVGQSRSNQLGILVFLLVAAATIAAMSMAYPSTVVGEDGSSQAAPLMESVKAQEQTRLVAAGMFALLVGLLYRNRHYQYKTYRALEESPEKLELVRTAIVDAAASSA